MATNEISWDNIPTHLIEIIAQKIVGSCEDLIRFSAVSKSWQSVASEMKEDGSTMLLSPESPLLLLAEEVPQETLVCCDINVDEEGLEEEEPGEDQDVEDDEHEGEEEDEDEDQEGEEEDEDQEGEEEEAEEEGDFGDEDQEEGDDNEENSGSEEDVRDQVLARYVHLISSIGNARGIYSLSTGKTYTVELPEAAGKFILGTNKGWLLTVGQDSDTNLLHPLLGHQISLPRMSKLSKVTMSSKLHDPRENVLGDDKSCPIIMVICGERGSLGFARVGDELWKKVESPSVGPFVDITYHMGKFYGINSAGEIFVCNIDDGYTSGATGAPVAICPFFPANFGSMYLVDSENDLWFLARIRTVKYFKPPNDMRVKYRTTDFLVWRLEPTVSEDGDETFLTWIQKRDLGGKAFFVGLNSSVSLSSSSCIRANCIYFTDDISDLYYPDGGGHDMGIFDVESGTIEPHFQGKSIHPISPPLWYI